MPTQRISIVTPTRNAAAFLPEAIDSVLSQDFEDLEYIVQDGCSTDGTPEIAQGYGSRLRFFSSPDSGVPDALNKGFSRTTGGILGYLNADDKYLPGALRQVAEAFDRYKDAAVIYWDAQLIDGAGAVLGAYPTETHSLARLKQTCYICQPAAFFRREAFDDVQGFDPSFTFIDETVAYRSPGGEVWFTANSTPISRFKGKAFRLVHLLRAVSMRTSPGRAAFINDIHPISAKLLFNSGPRSMKTSASLRATMGTAARIWPG